MSITKRSSMFFATFVVAAVALVGCSNNGSGTNGSDGSSNNGTSSNSESTSGGNDSSGTDSSNEGTDSGSSESGSSNGGGSAAQACEDISTAMADATNAMTEAGQTGLTDPSAAKDLIKTQADAMAKAAQNAKDGDVKDAAQKVADAYNELADKWGEMPDMTNMGDPDVASKAAEVGAEMADVSTKLTEAIGDFTTLCMK